MKTNLLRNLRRISQGIFLLLFLFLFIQTESQGADELGYPVKIFLDFDPLILVSTLLSSHVIIGGFLLSFILIIITVILGRVFCGWICPLGTLHTMVGSFKKGRARTIHPRWYRFKYYILLFILASSVFTAQFAGIFDPISFLIRSLSLSIYPIFTFIIRAFFDTVYVLHIPIITNVSEFIYDLLKQSILSFRQPFFFQGIFIGLIFFIVLALNLYERRFWCKYLCPLGALLGILSRYALLKRSVSEGCPSCGVCENVCQGGAVIDRDGTWRGTECLYCMDCDDLCPHNAVNFGFGSTDKPASMNLERRHVFTSIIAGITAVPLLRITPFSKKGFFDTPLIRPPGALKERDFLERCVRCGECMKVCITNGLQPTLVEAGLEGLWTPRLVPTIGYCEFRCTLCGQVCPTGAIRKLTLKEKEEIKIGMAVIDTGRCLPHAYGTPCIVCEEVCPTPEKAIWLEERSIINRSGGKIAVKQPKIDLERCIGCGTCEANCPVRGKPAIYVVNSNESRSDDNRLLLGF